MRQERICEALEEIWDAVALLRWAAKELPPLQQALFLAAVERLVDVAAEISGLFEPVDAA